MSLPKRMKYTTENPCKQDLASEFLALETRLAVDLKTLSFGKPVDYIYSPLEYAFNMHSNFVKKFLKSSIKILFIPFGEVQIVKGWFGMTGQVGCPERQHPLRKVSGLDCTRSEVSGKKFWEFFKAVCGEPRNFFRHCFVYNICPLAFLTNTGKNITPAELKAEEQKALNAICDATFVSICNLLKVETIIGIGNYAEKRAKAILKNHGITNIQVAHIPHPSPRNLKNSKNWSEVTLKILEDFNFIQFLQPT